MQVLVPKVFHRIWLGGREMPKEFAAWGQTWLDHHPGWVMKTWTEKELPTPRYPELLAQCPHLSQQSNIYRYEVMYREGGIYLDTDFECLKNIEPLIEGHWGFAAYQLQNPQAVGAIACGFFGVVPGHALLNELVEDLSKADMTKHGSIGPGYFTNHVVQYPTFKVFEPELFYPYYFTERHRRGESFPEASAVHHWSGTWFPHSFGPLARKTEGTL